MSLKRSENVTSFQNRTDTYDRNELRQRSCISTLTEATKLLQEYCDQVKRVCTEWKQLPVSQLDYAIENKFITGETLYFDNTVLTKKTLEDSWVTPVKNTWLKLKLAE